MEQMIDPRVLEAIVAAAPYAAGGAAEVGRTVGEGAGQAVGAAIVTEAFGKLRDHLRRKSGDDGRVAKSVDEVVAEPDSEGLRLVLAERLAASGADGDPEVGAAARELLDAVRAQPGGERRVENAMIAVGKYIAQADHGGTARVKVERPERREE